MTQKTRDYKKGQRQLKRLLRDLSGLQGKNPNPSDSEIQALYARTREIIFIFLRHPIAASVPTGKELAFDKMVKEQIASSNAMKLEVLNRFVDSLIEALEQSQRWFSDDEGQKNRFAGLWNKYLWPMVLAIAGGLIVAYLAKVFGWI